MLLQRLLIVAAAALLYVQQCDALQVGPPVETCRVYCEFQMFDIDKVLRVGESVKPIEENPLSEADPCLTYICDVTGEMRVEVETCSPTKKVCPDGKASYWIPGSCCVGCKYLNTLPFTGPELLNGSEPDVTAPPPNTWSAWSSWTECSLSCGGGRQSRMRQCMTVGARELDCTGLTVDIRDCNTHHCPIHGGWTKWTKWSECSTTCDNGTETRTRSCTNPVPQYNGNDCEGDHQEIQTCFLKHCPVDCEWLPWTEWGDCTHECGGGIQIRSRDFLVEQYGGRPCEGKQREVKGCNEHHCPIHGNWSVWSQWSECSTTCGTGTQDRYRECNNPTPQYGGDNCTGKPAETQLCPGLPLCPVDCKWKEWSKWTDCSLSCASGTQTRSRTFEQALHGGKECEGPTVESQLCNTQTCPDPCVDNGEHPCFSEAVLCTKVTDTEFSCGDCPRGMEGDGIECTAVHECVVGSPCSPGVVCVDYDDGYSCGECPSGFTGSTVRGYDLQDATELQQVCTDINECEMEVNGGCHEQRECQNTQGGFECGPCRDGYVERDGTDCVLANPCAADEHNCERTEYCINHAVGEYHCKCPIGMIGNGRECAPDPDLDGVPNAKLTTGCDNPPCLVDNCPDVPNSGQSDRDGDGIGDLCDEDNDNDGIKDEDDNCKFVSNPNQNDLDTDAVGDSCDSCLYKSNPQQGDVDGDRLGDDCDPDIDGDNVINSNDNCLLVYNPRQRDRDRDGIGQACDNCPINSNIDQEDSDMDGVGDVCDRNRDRDRDGIKDTVDKCRSVVDPDQLNHDADSLGDACDTDDDNDGVLDDVDNCPLVANKDQLDSDRDGRGDACATDYDGDGMDDTTDACPRNSKIRRTMFFNAIVVNLDKKEQAPYWDYISETEVIQRLNSGPGLLLSRASFRSFEFTGTFYVDTTVDNDYFGLVYNYYNNKQFMLAAWKKSDDPPYWTRNRPQYETRGGMQIRIVDSKNGPYNDDFKKALWNSNNVTKNQATTLWKDPNQVGWKHRTAYRWNLQYSAVHRCTRIRIYSAGSMMIDSGCQCNPSTLGPIEGGKLGLYTFSQPAVIYSDMSYKCLDHSQLDEVAHCSSHQ